MRAPHVIVALAPLSLSIFVMSIVMIIMNKEGNERECLYIILFYILPIIVLHPKEWLPILDGKLCHHCTCPEHHAVLGDIVSVSLTEDTPILQSPI